MKQNYWTYLKNLKRHKKNKANGLSGLTKTAAKNRFAAMLADVVTIGRKSLSASVRAGRSIFSFS